MMDQAENSIKHIEVASLGAVFSPPARQRVTEFLQSFVSFEPTLGLLYGAIPTEGAGKGSWSMTALGAQTVEELATMYAKFGSVVCYDIDGIRVIIPQLAHIEELESGVLEFDGDRIRPIAVEDSQ